MRKLALTAGAIGLATIFTLYWHARAEDGVPGATPPVTTLPAQPTENPKYQMFLDSSTPVRPPTSVRIKEAAKPSIKEKSAGKGKIDQSKIQTQNLLAKPKADPNLTPPMTTDQDLYKVKVKFPTLTPGTESEWARVKTYGKGKDQHAIQSDDDAALNAAACRIAAAAGRPLPSFCRPQPVLIDRSYLDRMEADRVEQLRAGPGGFNPNKP